MMGVKKKDEKLTKKYVLDDKRHPYQWLVY
jgi:hypothetical protein